MLEILLIISLCRSNGRIVEAKGHPAGRYKFFTALLWIGGEITGAIVAAILTSGSEGRGFIYLFALAGAAIGAGLSRWMVKRVQPAFATEAFD